MDIKRNYQLTLQTITPLHIGSGEELRLGFDFITDQKYTYRLDVDKLITDKGSLLKPGRNGQYPIPADLLTDADRKNSTYFRYRLSGKPNSQKSDARLKEVIKDVHDRPYIPGSSIKGAIRTALAWSVWPEIKPTIEVDRLNGSQVEKQIFGKDPNHDIFKALQISDLLSQKSPDKILMVAGVYVVSKGGEQNIPIEMEIVRPDQQFQGSLSIDNFLFENRQAKKELNFTGKQAWFDNLCFHINQHSLYHAAHLMNWFKNRQDCAEVFKVLKMITEALEGGLPEGSAVLPVGFGVGWDGITFGSRLKNDPNLWPAIVKKARLSRKRINPDDPESFPATRRAMQHPAHDAFVRPLGWVRIDLKPEN